MIIPNNEMTILRPPDIPKLNHPEDCRVLLLLFIKFDINNWKIEFSTDNIISIRDLIKSELLSNRINESKKYFLSSNRNKRKSANQNQDELVKNKKKKEQVFQRMFMNIDQESCWINSCLQL